MAAVVVVVANVDVGCGTTARNSSGSERARVCVVVQDVKRMMACETQQ